MNDSETTELIKTTERVSILLQNKTWSSLPLPVRMALVFSFRTNWKNLNCTLYEDAQKVSGEYKNISFLKCINVSDWLSERNPCLISFLSSATGVAIND